MKSRIISWVLLGSIFIGGVQAHAATISNSDSARKVTVSRPNRPSRPSNGSTSTITPPSSGESTENNTTTDNSTNIPAFLWSRLSPDIQN